LASSDRKAVTIRLSLKPTAGPSRATSTARHHVVDIQPQMTLDEFDLLVLGLFHGTTSGSTGSNSQSAQSNPAVEYYIGYPPRKLSVNNGQELVQDHIQGGENVLVQLVSSLDVPAEPLPVSKVAKRKAAEVAQANFLNHIHAQEELQQQEQVKKTRKVTQSKPCTSSPASNVHSLHNKNHQSRNKNSSPQSKAKGSSNKTDPSMQHDTKVQR